jgi:hypothetical protein
MQSRGKEAFNVLEARRGEAQGTGQNAPRTAQRWFFVGRHAGSSSFLLLIAADNQAVGSIAKRRLSFKSADPKQKH